MTIVNGSTRRGIFWLAGAAAMLLVLMLTACKSQPNLTGKWAATGKTLENGEVVKGILDLKQEGNQVTGTVRDFGGQSDAVGTIQGNHFELSRPGSNDSKPFVVGDITDKTIQGTKW